MQPFPKLSCRICGKTSNLLVDIDISLPANIQYVEKYLAIANVTVKSDFLQTIGVTTVCRMAERGSESCGLPYPDNLSLPTIGSLLFG